MEVGTVVLWSRSDGEVPRGSMGIVKGGQAGLLKVGFPQGTWNFERSALTPLACGDFVLYSGNDEDIPRDNVGKVVGMKAAGMVTIQYAHDGFEVPYLTLRHIDEITAKREGLM
mmetsp:Transcript_61708/g.199961  ORF Transcript_61708/g.199961 Transcript_61708/m.199961 type:complete len:114 (-) Transcript_61708:41-382(-)